VLHSLELSHPIPLADLREVKEELRLTVNHSILKELNTPSSNRRRSRELVLVFVPSREEPPNVTTVSSSASTAECPNRSRGARSCFSVASRVSHLFSSEREFYFICLARDERRRKFKEGVTCSK